MWRRCWLLTVLLILSVPDWPKNADKDWGPSLAKWSGGGVGRLGKEQQTKFTEYIAQELKPISRVELIIDPRNPFLNDGDAYVWDFQAEKTKGYLVLLNPHHILTPSAERAWLYIVDERGSEVRRYSFDTGWRMYAKSAQYEKVDWLSSPVLIQEMEPGDLGGGPTKIYIGFDGLRPAVVRLEDEAGKLKPMDDTWSDRSVGPVYPAASIAQLEESLRGQNEVKRIEALIWLAGRHYENSKNVIPPLKDKGIVDAVKNLRSSSVRYVSELAMTVPVGSSGLK